MKVKSKPLLRDQVRNQVVDLIKGERLEVGDRLLPEKELAQRFDCSFLTVRAALEDLVSRGIIDRRPGSGTYLKRLIPSTTSTPTLADRMVALVLAADGHLYSDLNSALIAQLQAASYVTVTHQVHQNTPDHQALVGQLKDLAAHGCKRVVLASGVNDDLLTNTAFREFLAASFPQRIQAINLVRPKPEWGVHCVTYDLKAGHQLAVNHLADQGHRRIVYLAGEMREFEANRTYARAYTDAMIDAGLADQIRVVVMSCSAFDNPVELLRTILAEHHPTAILGMMDYRSALASKALRELQVKVPEDIALVGYFNTPYAEHEDLTSVDINIDSCARAIRELLDLPLNAPAETRIIPSSLVIRASSRRPGETADSERVAPIDLAALAGGHSTITTPDS